MHKMHEDIDYVMLLRNLLTANYVMAEYAVMYVVVCV